MCVCVCLCQHTQRFIHDLVNCAQDGNYRDAAKTLPGWAGDYFVPIDDAYVFGDGSSHSGFSGVTSREDHPSESALRICPHFFNSSRCTMVKHDTARMLAGACAQPAGEYCSVTDWIRGWNASLGVCHMCSKSMVFNAKHAQSLIDLDQVAEGDDFSQPGECRGRMACMFRLRESGPSAEIHLKRNMHPRSVCVRCNSLHYQTHHMARENAV